MATIFDVIKKITDPKIKSWNDVPKDEQDTFTNWMINKFISMDEDYVELVNEIQKNTWQMEPRFLFAIYKDLLPQQSHYFRYIKGSKKDINWEYVFVLTKYFEISKKEAIEYLEEMDEDELSMIFSEIGYVPKDEEVKPKKKPKKK